MYYICIMKKDKIITLRVSNDEFKTLNNFAKDIGLSLSSYIRMCALLKSKKDG